MIKKSRMSKYDFVISESRARQAAFRDSDWDHGNGL